MNVRAAILAVPAADGGTHCYGLFAHGYGDPERRAFAAELRIPGCDAVIIVSIALDDLVDTWKGPRPLAAGMRAFAVASD